MPIFKNLFKKVKDAVRAISVDKDAVLEEAGQHISEMMLEKAIELAPDGSENLDQYPFRFGQRPSERMGLIPIKESLSIEDADLVVSDLQVGEVRMKMWTKSFHTTYFTKGLPERYAGGTRPHRVPKSGYMFQTRPKHPLAFWYGVATEQGRSGSGVYGNIWHVWTFVTPGGISMDKFGDFVQDAWEEIEPEAREMSRWAAQGSMARIREIWRR